MRLDNALPVELLRRRDEAVLWGPLGIRQHDALQELLASQSSSPAGSQQVSQHDRRQLLVVHQLLEVVAGNAVFRRDLLEDGLIGEDDGDRLGLTPIGVDEDVGNDRA